MLNFESSPKIFFYIIIWLSIYPASTDKLTYTKNVINVLRARTPNKRFQDVTSKSTWRFRHETINPVCCDNLNDIAHFNRSPAGRSNRWLWSLLRWKGNGISRPNAEDVLYCIRLGTECQRTTQM